MKGVILAGGSGSRLAPLTKVTNKHLLPIFDKPMIYYAIEKMREAGIKEIMLILGEGHAGHFLELLGDGKDFGVKINYMLQKKPLGIAHALSLTESFVDGESVCVILGDNIFIDEINIESFKEGARIFLTEVEHPERFGVATLNEQLKITKIVEKPSNPESNYIVTGIYIYDNKVYDVIRTLKISDRGEYELTDVNNYYLKNNLLQHSYLLNFWSDAGTFESLYNASKYMRGIKNER